MFSAECPDRFWDPCTLLLSENRGSCSGVKRPGHEVVHSPSSTVEIESDRFTLDGGNFTFYNLFVPFSIIMSEEGAIEEPEPKKERKLMSLEKVDLLDKSHMQ